METFKIRMYRCGCGYNTSDVGNASKHKKVVCGYEMTLKPYEFVLKDCLKHDMISVEEIEIEREHNRRTATQLQNTIDRLQSSLAKMSKSVDIIDDEDDVYDTNHNGIVYFITDKDVPDRGKVGRTKNTDVKKLKTRYSTFGCPSILCYLSTDIKEDENALKKLMRDAGCMKSNTEMISNCVVAREIFYNFMTSKLT